MQIKNLSALIDLDRDLWESMICPRCPHFEVLRRFGEQLLGTGVGSWLRVFID